MINETMEAMLEAIRGNASRIDPEQVRRLLDQLKEPRAIFIYGAGRSGLVARAFAMRLMHLGLTVHFVGDTITPAIRPEDLLIAISGSGETPSVRAVVNEAKRRQAKVVAVTASPESTIGRAADLLVIVPSKITRAGDSDFLARQMAGAHEPLTPLGTSFELTTMVLVDSLIVELMRDLHLSEEEMAAKHASLE